MNISIKKNIDVEGFCPVQQDNLSITVTYRKVSVLGDSNAYAAVCNIDCPIISECSDLTNCPVALQKTYW